MYIRRQIKRKVRKLILSRRPLRKDPELDGRRLLFICGLHRSGTTILHRIIRNHQDVSGGRGGSIAGTPSDGWQSTGTAGTFAFAESAHLCEIPEAQAALTRSELSRQWGAYWDLEKRILVRKAPKTIIRSRYLQSVFPGAGFVFVVRHPIAVSYATLGQKWTEYSLPELMRHWAVAHTIMLEDFGALERAMVIRYEDFVAEPRATCNSIYAFAGLQDYAPNKTVSDHNGKYFQLWEAEAEPLADRMRAAFDPTDRLLDRFGYSLSSPYDSAWTEADLAT